MNTLEKDRRNNVYLITSESALIGLYSALVSLQRIHEVLKEVKDGFIIRQGTSEEETNLQILAVAETKLFNLVLSREGK